MIDVHLIGYTADLEHLVLDLDGGAKGRYRLVVDADLFATLDELREERRAAGLSVGDAAEYVDPDEAEPSDDDTSDVSEDDAPLPDSDGPDLDLLAEVEADRLDAAADAGRGSHNVRLVAAPAAEPDPDPDLDPDPDPGAVDEARTSEDVSDETPTDPEPEPEPEPEPVALRATMFPDAAQPSRRPESSEGGPTLSPAQIQAMLRAGRSPRSVARDADTDIAWIERWLPPILAERTRVLERAHAKRLDRPRLGVSRDPLGVAVPRMLRQKGVAEEDLTWDVGRRNDGKWKVSVRFPHRGRNRTATWLYDPADDALRSASELARELGFTRSKRATPAKSANKKPAKKKPAKKKPAKTSAAEKSAAKKASAVGPAAAEATTKKTTAKKPTAKKSTAKKSTAKKSTAKKPAAKKTTAQPSTERAAGTSDRPKR